MSFIGKLEHYLCAILQYSLTFLTKLLPSSRQVFAFLALIVFVADAFIHFKQKNSGQETDGEAKS